MTTAIMSIMMATIMNNTNIIITIITKRAA